jgi:hypothetical protein
MYSHLLSTKLSADLLLGIDMGEEQDKTVSDNLGRFIDTTTD